MASSILEFVMKNRATLDRDWGADLGCMNVFDDIEPLYEEAGSSYKGNVAFAYIVLAYSAKSEYLEMHKTRTEVRERIMVSIGGLSVMTDPFFTAVSHNESEAANTVIDWYIEYQKDWRWKSIISAFEYHSAVMSIKPDPKDPGKTLYIGKCYEEGMKRRRDGEKILQEIRKEFADLDTSLEKEDRQKITEDKDFMSHEQFVADKLKKKK